MFLPTAAARGHERQWVRGTVEAVAPERFSVYVVGLDLNLAFTVADSTVITGFGAHVRPPEHTRPELPDVARRGTMVEVHYSRHGTVNQAEVIRLSSGTRLEAGRSFDGKVTAVSATALTLEANGQERKFAVDRDTRVRSSRPLGPDPKVGDIAARNDRVLVLFEGDGAIPRAFEICPLGAER